MHKDWRRRLHAYMGGIVNDLGGIPETIGGVEDHVHLLVGLRATHCLADVLREIKASSSRWVHEELNNHLFSWQEGYGAFTVSASQLGAVKNYIANQEEHHRKKTFQEEYLEFLIQSGVEYDEKYLW
jgi:putative transposase